MTGCQDSAPSRSTHNCSALGGSVVTLHGLGFQTVEDTLADILIGQSVTCTEITVINDWSMRCVTSIDSPVDINSEQTYKVEVEMLEG